MMKKAAVSTLLKGLLDRVHRTLFRHMVKSGFVLCAAPLGEDGRDATDDNTETQQDDQTGDDTGTAAETVNEQGEGDGTDEEEVVVTIGDEAPPTSDEDEGLEAPDLVNKLRRMNREKERELRELRAKAKAPATGQPAEPPKVDKPTLADCDYDEAAFESKLTAWHEQQVQAKAEQAKQEAAAKKAQDDWNATLEGHDKAKAALKVADYDEAEAVVSDTLSVTQRAIIVSGADNSALVEYALGKNPAKAKELASIKDPVKFAFAVAKLETQLKVTPRKTAPAPERVVRGGAPAAGVTDSKLASLEAKADRTGDRSEVIAYRREQRLKQA